MSPLRRGFAAACSAASVVFGVDNIAGNPIAPGTDVGLTVRMEAATPGTPARASLSTDAGDLRCLVRVKLRTGSSAARAVLSNGTELAIARLAAPPHAGWLEISEALTPAAAGAKFTWPAGVDLVVEVPPGQVRAELDDWQVFLHDGKSDSRAKAVRRKRWLAVSLTCFVASLLGTTATVAWPPRAGRAPFTPERCVAALVRTVEGDTPAETRWMQSLLREVLLEGARAPDVLGRIPLTFAQRSRLWFKARSLLLAKLSHLMASLVDVQHRLSSR